MRETWLALFMAALLARLAGAWADRDQHGVLRRATQALEGPAAAWGVGALTALFVWIAWGHFNPTATVHDEAAYLFQAKTYAAFRLANAPPVIPEFFEQFHLLLSPAYAAKYPPGTALAFVPGIWLGIPALMPIVLAALTGALLFLLARRLANPWVGLLAWGVWITAAPTLDRAASFFSQDVTTPLWLAGWWMLLEWRDTGQRRWLVALSLCTAWMAITRPLTAVGYAIPTAAVVLVIAWRRREWKNVAIAAIAGVAVLGILPITSHGAVGDWRRMPWSVYAEEYMPSDRMGFGLSSVPPRRALPEDMRMLGVFFAPVYAEHVPKNLPSIAKSRAAYALSDLFGGARFPLELFAIVGLLGLSVPMAVAASATVLSFALYLPYGHTFNWSLYYVESQPVLAFLAALGLWRFFVWVSAASFPRRPADGSIDRTGRARGALAVAVFVVVMIPHYFHVLSTTRFLKVRDQMAQRWFFDRVAEIPERSIVFVRYAPQHIIHRSLIANEPDLANADAWIVYDRGADDVRLANAARGRVPYLYDEATHTLVKGSRE